jgi:hypothetical protein
VSRGVGATSFGILAVRHLVTELSAAMLLPTDERRWAAACGAAPMLLRTSFRSKFFSGE